jgi:CheY-like chemotaxis protein
MEKLKILVVDDAAFIRDMMRKAIRNRFPDFVVEEAINGRKAQLQLKRNTFDLILCDWEMPEMSGIELLSWVRKEHEKQDTPFIMVTSRGDKENVVEAVKAGVSDYIGKPFSNEKLLSKVIKVLGKSHNLRVTEGRSAPAAQGSVAAGSLDALRAKPAAPARAPSETAQGSAGALMGAATGMLAKSQPSPPTQKTAALPKQTAVKGVAYLRFSDNINQCVIKALSLRQISLIFRIQDGAPSILESVVVDLQQGETGQSDAIARINGYVHMLQAVEQKMDSGLINVVINIVDQDPQKLTYLSTLIAKGTTSSRYVPGA